MKGRNKSTWILADHAISVSPAAPNSTHSSLLFSCLPLSQHSPVRSSWPQSWIHSSRDSPILWRQQMLAASLEESFLAWICQSFDKHPSLDIIQLCFRVSREFSLCSEWANSLQGEKITHFLTHPWKNVCLFSARFTDLLGFQGWGQLVYTGKIIFFETEQFNNKNYLDHPNTELT